MVISSFTVLLRELGGLWNTGRGKGFAKETVEVGVETAELAVWATTLSFFRTEDSSSAAFRMVFVRINGSGLNRKSSSTAASRICAVLTMRSSGEMCWTACNLSEVFSRSW